MTCHRARSSLLWQPRPVGAALTLWLTLFALPLDAQPGGTLPGPEVVEQARPAARKRAAELTRRAQAHYDRGELREALEAYRAAYQVVPAPELLFNMGQCTRRLHEPERAIFFFHAYLDGKPDAANRALVESMIEEQRAQLRSQDAAPPAQPVAAGTGGAVPASGAVARTAPSAHAEPTVDTPPVTKRWWFWTLAGAVLVAAGTTALVLTVGQDEPSSSSEGSLGVVSWR